jgi:hypothetical protein
LFLALFQNALFGQKVVKRRELLGTVDQSSLRRNWHILARSSCFAAPGPGTRLLRTPRMFAVVSNVIAFARIYAAGRARWQTSPKGT